MDTPQRVTDAVGVLPSHAAGGGGSGRKTGSDGGHVSWAVVRRVGRLFLPYWVPLVAVFGVLVVNAYFDSLMPQLYRSFVDEAVPKQDVERIVSLAIQVVGVLCATVAMKVGKEALTTHVAEHMARSLRESLFSHLQGLPLQHFVQNRSAEFAALFNQELTGATGGVCRLIFSTAQNLFTLAFLLRAMYGMDWRLTVGCVVLVPAFYVPSLYMSSRMRAYKQEALQRRSGMNEALAESLTMAGVILARTFGQQRFFLDRFTRESEALSRTTSRANLLHTSFFQVLLVAMSFMSIIVYMLGALIFILFSTDLSNIQIKGTYGQVVGLGGITMGTVVAFSSYIGRLYGPLSDLSGVQIQLATCAVSFERIFHYVDLPAAAPVPASSSSSSRRRRGSGTSSSRLRKEEQEEQEVPLLRLGDVVGDVRFEQVSFSYAPPPPLLLDSSLPEGGAPPPEAAEEAAGGGEGTRAPPDCGGKAEERPKGTLTRPEEEEAAAAPAAAEEETAVEEARRWTLADVSVHFRAGELTAIVGANGSGKTTLAFLLMGFLRPQRGEIFIDGHPLSRIAGSHHRSSSFCFPSRAPAPGPLGLAAHVGFLSQECYLLNDTVATNLRLGRADATTDELHEICRVVGVHDKICSLPDGYDTVVGHRASSLSGGEKQKLAIARVLLRRPKLLVLDEFDSSLDPHSQRRIHDYINRQFAAHTRIVIAHRPEAVRNADRVVVLHRGRVVECGTPAALLEKNGYFASFFSTAGSSVLA